MVKLLGEHEENFSCSTKMPAECAICFENKPQYKILQCGHYYCHKCLDDLATRPAMDVIGNSTTPTLVQPSLIDLASMDISTDDPLPVGTTKIECPQCRHVTCVDGITALKTRLNGHINCTTCDMDKDVCDFQWCQDCSISVCSACFMDKHVNTDEATQQKSFHKSSKWVEGEPIERLVAHLMAQTMNNRQEQIDKCTKYIDEYLQGLSLYLHRDVGRRVDVAGKELYTTAHDVAQNFAIDPTKITPLEMSRNKIDPLIRELSRVCGTNWSRRMDAALKNCHVDINAASYESLAKLILPDKVVAPAAPQPPVASMRQFVDMDVTPHQSATATAPVLSEETSSSSSGSSLPIPSSPLTNIHKQCSIVTTVVNGLSAPRDLCLLDDERTLLIADGHNGLFTYSDGNVAPVLLRHRYTRISRCVQYPACLPGVHVKGDEQMHAMAMVQGHNQWSYILIYGRLIPTINLQQLEIGRKSHFPLPAGRVVSMASCARHLFALTDTQLYSFAGVQADHTWRLIDGTRADANSRLGPLTCARDGTTLVTIINTTWHCIDMLTFADVEHTVRATRRIDQTLTCPVSVHLDTRNWLMGDDQTPKLYVWCPDDATTVPVEFASLTNKCAYSLCADPVRRKIYAIFCALGDRKRSTLEIIDW